MKAAMPRCCAQEATRGWRLIAEGSKGAWGEAGGRCRPEAVQTLGGLQQHPEVFEEGSHMTEPFFEKDLHEIANQNHKEASTATDQTHKKGYK